MTIDVSPFFPIAYTVPLGNDNPRVTFLRGFIVNIADFQTGPEQNNLLFFHCFFSYWSIHNLEMDT